MNETSAGLRTLHRLHQQLRDVVDELARGPRQIAARETAIAKKKAELEARRARVKQLRASADQKNLTLRTSEAKIVDYKSKLNVAVSNREYEILKNSVEADTMAKSVLEDEIIEALELIDGAQGEVKQGELDVQKAEAELQVLMGEIKAREPGLQEQARLLQSEVLAAERFLPAAIVPEYRRLIEAHGADALAAVQSRACGNCYVGLTQQQVVELRTGKLLFCRSCHRLQYLPEREE